MAYYGARYYDNRISTWLSVDPLASQYPSLSSYNFVANNPLSLIDPDGMQIDPASQEEWDQHKSNITKRRDKLMASEIVLHDVNGKNPSIEFNENSKEITRLNSVLDGMAQMEDPNNSQMYAIDNSNCSTCLTHMNAQGTVVIPASNGSTTYFVHEVTHGIQFENNKLGLVKGSNASLNSFQNEIDAYQNQAAYGGFSSLDGINPNVPTVSNYSQIDKNFISGIGGGGLYASMAETPINPGLRGNQIVQAYPKTSSWNIRSNETLRSVMGDVF
ncbi:MAG: hypothetical protein EP346_01785 [Bacteroidetes bacterium]|nr:MAG: hypothetical protein EP346_01785 [Bacteroidota bacterium]